MNNNNRKLEKETQMTTDERVEVRTAISGAGFRRIGYTNDDGTGVYTESWLHTDGTRLVAISWAPKTPDTEEQGRPGEQDWPEE